LACHKAKSDEIQDRGGQLWLKYSDFGGFVLSVANFFSQIGPIMPKMCPSVSISFHRTFFYVTKPNRMKFKTAGAHCGKKYGDFGGFCMSVANFFFQIGLIMPKLCPSV
jgi:hypothetical protein